MPGALPPMAWTVEIINFKYVVIIICSTVFIDFVRIFDIAFFIV